MIDPSNPVLQAAVAAGSVRHSRTTEWLSTAEIAEIAATPRVQRARGRGVMPVRPIVFE